MKLPGPDHPITIEPAAAEVVVTAGGREIARSHHALALREARYPVIYYIPRGDVAMDVLSRSARTTHCPYKGDASYFAMTADGGTARDIAWSYEDPFPAMAEIGGHVAFYADRVDRIGIVGAPTQ